MINFPPQGVDKYRKYIAFFLTKTLLVHKEIGWVHGFVYCYVFLNCLAHLWYSVIISDVIFRGTLSSEPTRSAMVISS